jgi:hypothetical protein
MVAESQVYPIWVAASRAGFLAQVVPAMGDRLESPSPVPPGQPSGRCPEHASALARSPDDGARSRRPACRDSKDLTVLSRLMYGLSWRRDPRRNVPLLLGIKLLLNTLPDGRGGFCSPEGTFERDTHHVVKDDRSRQRFPQLGWTHNLNTSDYISAASASQPPLKRDTLSNATGRLGNTPVLAGVLPGVPNLLPQLKAYSISGVHDCPRVTLR